MSDAGPSNRVTPSRHAAPTQPRWIAPAALAVAVIAVGLAVWSLVQQPAATEQASPEATTQPSAESKATVCAAFDTVRTAVSAQTNADLGPDPVAREAVAANARLATLGGGSYLLSQLDDTVDTDLADAIRSFAGGLQDIGMSQLAGVPNNDPALTARLTEAQDASTRIAEMCA